MLDSSSRQTICPTVTKTGYNFSAWSPAVASTMPAANTTYTATWTVKTTTITIDANTANHGSTTPGTVTATWGSALPSFTAASGASGYSLTGYYTAATDGNKIINADGTLVRNTTYATDESTPVWKSEGATLTLYAQYESVFTVSFNSNGGSAVSPITQASEGASITMPAAPTYADHTFQGWVIGGNTYAAGASYTPTANVTAYATWKADCAGGNAEVWFSSSNKNDAGEYFAAMSTSSNTTQLVGSGVAKLIAVGSSDLQADPSNKKVGYRLDSRLNIVFKFDATTSLDIYLTNGGSSGRTCQLASFSSDKALSAIGTSDYSSKTTVTSNVSATGAVVSTVAAGSASVSSGVITITGSGGLKISYTSLPAGYYVFYSTSSSSMYVSGFEESSGSGTCYYVTYNGNGAESGSISDPTAYAEGDDVTVLGNTGVSAFVKDGYRFTGWNTLANGTGTPYSAGGTISGISGNVTLHAQWSDASIHTITAAVNNGEYGSVSPSSITVADGSTISISTNVLTCDGNTLTATATSATAEYTYAFSNWTGVTNGASVTTDLTATANFTRTANNYNLTWDLGGGTTTSTGTGIASGVSSNTTTSQAYGTALTAPTVTKANYTFSAWSPAVAATMPAANTTYTATFTANQYSVTHSLTNMSTTSGETGANAATYGTNYSAVLAADGGYTLPATITVTAGATDITANCTWNSSTGAVSIPGSYITGNITITAVAETPCFLMVANSSAGSDATLANNESISQGSKNCTTLIGGTAVYSNADGDSKTMKVAKPSGGAQYGWYFNVAKDVITITLPSSIIQVGSVITFSGYVGSANYGISVNTSTTLTKSGSSGEFTKSYTVTAGDTHLIGKNVLVLKREGGSAKMYSFSVSNCQAGTSCVTPVLPSFTTPNQACTTGEFAAWNATVSNAAAISAAAGSQTVSYSWKNSSSVEVATTASYTPSAAGTYTVTATVHSDASGYIDASVTSSTLTASLYTATSISTQPTTAVEAEEGENFTLGTGMVAAGQGDLSYQWYSYTTSGGAGEASIGSATSATYTTSKAAGTYYYKVKVTADCGTVASNMITVTVTEAPCFEFKAGTTKAGSGWDVPNNGAITTALWTDGSQILTGGTLTNTSGSSLGGNASYGLVYAASSNKQVTVALTGDNILVAGSVITITGYSNNSTDACGFTISGNNMSPATYTPASANYTKFTQTYTVVASDGVEGEDSFTIDPKTNIRVYLNAITITGCGERVGYTISFAGNGNTGGSMTDVTEIEEGDDVTLAANGFTKNGYSFANWTADVDVTVNSATVADGDPIADEATIQNVTSDITLTAQWTPNNYTITYNLNGASWAGGYSAPANYTVGTGATLPVAGNMTNTGYTFSGWYANSDLSTGGVVTTIGTSDFGNKEFWAKWTENTYDVTYNANGGTGTTAAQNGHYITLRDNGFTAPSGKTFVEWNTANDGSGDSYNPGEEVELIANLALYAIWADDYTITWDESAKLSGVAVTPNLGGGNYTITASVSAWTGTLTADMISTLTDGVTITNVEIDNSASPKTITATFNVGASVAGTSISLELDVPAYGVYGAKSSPKEITIDRCTGSSSGSDGVLFSAEFKDSGLGTSNICDEANTAYTFTTTELKAAPTGGSISAYTTGELSHLKYVDNGVYLKGTDGVIKITLSNAIATNDLFEYVNVHSSCPNAYLRHTSPSTTSDQIVLTGYSSRNVKVMLPAAFNEKTELYIVKNTTDFKLHKAAIVRPAFLMLVDDEASTGNLEGTNVELTTSTYLSVMKGGHVYYTSPTSGDVKITQSSSKNYITLAKTAGYLKVVLNDALQEGDIIGFDTSNGSSEICFATTTTRSTDEHTSSQLYTVGSSSPLKGQTTFYIWYYSSSTTIRGLQIARSGAAGGGGGTDQITPTLTWTPALNTDGDWDSGNSRLNKETGDADFTFTVTQDKNSLGALTYSSSNTGVATVTAGGTVHIVGAAGNATITATMAESGCYAEATASYNITVVDNCEDVAGTISTENLGCPGIRMTVTGHTTTASTSYQWYKDGATIGGATSDNYTATTAGEYYVIVTNTGEGHCPMASTNTVTIEATGAVSATKIVDSWYVKNGRRTPDIALIQTTDASAFTVKNGLEEVIWNSDESVSTGFAGCPFHMGDDGIIYLDGQTSAGAVPTGLTAGDETLTITVSGCSGSPVELSITIHKQAATKRPSVAFVVDGTKEGDFDEEEENHSVTTALYQFLDYGADEQGAFDLTGQNVYSTVDEKAIREHYSQFDAILITDDPSTDTKIGKKSCVDAFGTMIDIRPILSMEAYVSKLKNWGSKGVAGKPSSPNPRQYEMRLQCKDHEIYSGLPAPAAGTHVWSEIIDGEEYRHVIMVDSTKSPYAGVAYNEQTAGEEKPALQGFASEDMGHLLGLGLILNGTLHAGVERQEEPAARMMILGIQSKALPNALTDEGKKVIENALKYLLKTNMEEVDDCSNFFKGGTEGKERDWNTATNWEKNTLPTYETKVRILAPCELSGATVRVAQVDIVSSGTSSKMTGGTCSGSLTIMPTGALVVGGKVRTAEAPHFASNDLKPTELGDLTIKADETNGNGTLIFDNKDGNTQAVVEMYSKAQNSVGSWSWQYVAVPFNDNSSAYRNYYGSWLYRWAEDNSGWEVVPNRGAVYPWIGYCLTQETAKQYVMDGTLVETTEQEFTVGSNQDMVIGNSWTAPIQVKQFTDDDFGGLTKNIYLFNTGLDVDCTGSTSGGRYESGTYVVIPIHSAEYTGDSLISSLQAFTINNSSGSDATLTLDYDRHVRPTRSTDKVNAGPMHAPKRMAEESDKPVVLKILVSGDRYDDRLVLLEREDFSRGYDAGWDGEKILIGGNSQEIFSVMESGQESVTATPDMDGTVIGFRAGEDDIYTFHFEYDGYDEPLYLLDTDTKIFTRVLTGNIYTFMCTDKRENNRFLLTRKNAQDAPTDNADIRDEYSKPLKFLNNDKIYIYVRGVLYDITGKVVK